MAGQYRMLAAGQVHIKARSASLGRTAETGGLCTPRLLDTSCMPSPAYTVRMRPESLAAAAKPRSYRNTFVVVVAFAAPAYEFTSVQVFSNRFMRRAAHSQASTLTPFSLFCAVVLLHCCEQSSEEGPSVHGHTVLFPRLAPPTNL